MLFEKKKFLIVFLIISTLLLAFFIYKFLNVTVVHIYEDTSPTKIKLENKVQEESSHYIYDYIFKNKEFNRVKTLDFKKQNEFEYISKAIDELKEMLDILIKNNEYNIFNVLETNLNFLDIKDEELSFNSLKPTSDKKKEYVAESVYTLTLKEGTELVDEFFKKYEPFLEGKTLAVQKNQIKNKFIFSIIFTGFKSFQEAKKFCKKLHTNKDSCIVVESILDNIQYQRK